MRITKKLERNPQLLLLLENLGNGMGNAGATVKLLNQHNEVAGAVWWLKQMNDKSTTVVYLESKSRRRPVSFQAAHYFSSCMRFMVNLLTAVITMERGWQMMHVSEKKGALSAKSMVMTCMHEMRRLVLMTYHGKYF